MAETQMAIGFCQYGCGMKTAIAKRNRYDRDQIKGMPIQFIHGHNAGRRVNSNWWKGGRTKNGAGKYIYWDKKIDAHPRIKKSGYVAEHILIAEKVLGKYLPANAEIHHTNNDGLDNRNSNLVICQDRAYHFLLHKRLKPLLACGHIDWRKCWICNNWDNPINLYINPLTNQAHHRMCLNERRKNYGN